jgi:putative FmdB family regulatory protein
VPTYDYRCPNGHEFEVVHRMDDPSPEKCEICGAGPLVRVFHPVPVFFKGSGFYSTDYGRKKRKVESGGDGDGSKSDGASSKTADKPAEKTEKSTKSADA